MVWAFALLSVSACVASAPPPVPRQSILPQATWVPPSFQAPWTPQPPQVPATGNARLSLVRTGWHRENSLTTVYAEFRNVGTSPGYVREQLYAFLSGTSSTYTAFDKDGVVLGSGTFNVSAPQVVEPGGLLYYSGTAFADLTGIAKVEVTVPDFRPLGDPPIAYRVTSLKIDRGAGRLTAVVENASAAYAGPYCVGIVQLSGSRVVSVRCDPGTQIKPGQRARVSTSVGMGGPKDTFQVFASATWSGDRP